MPVLPPNAISDPLRALFAPDLPVGIRCWAILDGDAAGRVWVDDPLHPACAIVQELADSSAYLGGSFSAPILAGAVDELRRDREVVMGLWHDDPRLGLLPPGPYYDGTAIDFTDRAAGDALSRFLSIPDGCQMKAVDPSLFPRLAGYEWTVSLFGSAEKALEQGLGFCLMQGDTILSEAFAGPRARGQIEIGVNTPEPFRRNGYATLTCAWLIQACEARGYQTFWNTSAQNLPSLKLARRLGYQTEREFRVLAWSHTPGSP